MPETEESLSPLNPATDAATNIHHPIQAEAGVHHPVQAAAAVPKAPAAATQDENLRTVVLEKPITRPSGQRIETVLIRKPMGGALRRVTLSDLLSLNTASLEAVLPRVTEPQLVKQDFELVDPVDLVAMGTELVSFFVPRKERS